MIDTLPRNLPSYSLTVRRVSSHFRFNLFANDARVIFRQIQACLALFFTFSGLGQGDGVLSALG